jgi:ABC-type Fe3+-siderophore transport system permease subunit
MGLVIQFFCVAINAAFIAMYLVLIATKSDEWTNPAIAGVGIHSFFMAVCAFYWGATWELARAK